MFCIAKDLGKTIYELEESMDTAELMEWMAYKALEDPDHCNKIKNKVSLEKELTPEEISNQIRALFGA